MVDVRVDLLTRIPESDWPQIRNQLSEVKLTPEQAEFGGSPSEFVDLQEEDGRQVFLIYADDQLVGTGSLLTGPVTELLWPMGTRAVQLRGFVVDLRMQGKGIGTEASRQVIALAQEVDPDAQHLILSVNQRNPGARRTYEKVGFQHWPEPYLGGPIGPQDILYIGLQERSTEN